jgi:hypothetical protein
MGNTQNLLTQEAVPMVAAVAVEVTTGIETEATGLLEP